MTSFQSAFDRIKNAASTAGLDTQAPAVPASDAFARIAKAVASVEPGAAPGGAAGEQDIMRTAAQQYEGDLLVPEQAGRTARYFTFGINPREVERGFRQSIEQTAQAVATPGLRAQFIESVLNPLFAVAAPWAQPTAPMMGRLGAMATEPAGSGLTVDDLRTEQIAARGAAMGRMAGAQEGVMGDISRALGQTAPQMLGVAAAVATGGGAAPIVVANLMGNANIPLSAWTAGQLEYFDEIDKKRAEEALSGQPMSTYSLDEMRKRATISAVAEAGPEIIGGAVAGKVIGGAAKAIIKTRAGRATVAALSERGRPLAEAVLASRAGQAGAEAFARASDGTLKFRNGFFGQAGKIIAASAVEEGAEELGSAIIQAPFNEAPLSDDLKNGLYSAFIGSVAGGVGGVGAVGGAVAARGIQNRRDAFRPETNREIRLRQAHTDAMKARTNWSADLDESQQARVSIALNSLDGMAQEERGIFLRELADRRQDIANDVEAALALRQQLNDALAGARAAQQQFESGAPERAAKDALVKETEAALAKANADFEAAREMLAEAELATEATRSAVLREERQAQVEEARREVEAAKQRADAALSEATVAEGLEIAPGLRINPAEQVALLEQQIADIDSEMQMSVHDKMIADATYNAVREKVADMPMDYVQRTPQEVLSEIGADQGTTLEPIATPKNGARVTREMQALGLEVQWFRGKGKKFSSPGFFSMASRNTVFLNADYASGDIRATAMEELFHQIQMFRPEIAQAYSAAVGVAPIYEQGIRYSQRAAETSAKARLDEAALQQAGAAIAEVGGEQAAVPESVRRAGAARLQQEGEANLFARTAGRLTRGGALQPFVRFAARRGLMGREVYAAMSVIDAVSRAAAIERVAGKKPSPTLSPLARTLLWAEDADIQLDRDIAEAERPEQPAAEAAKAPAAGVSMAREFLSRPLSSFTPEWRAWFKDSKVVDENGNPMVLYHGTTSDIQEFDPEAPGKFDAGWLGRGSYFTSNPDTASYYASYRLPGAAGPNVVPVYVSLQNPLILSRSEERSKSQEMALALGVSISGMNANEQEARMLRDAAIEQGYDGVIFKYRSKLVSEQEVVAFRPNQIKSVFNERPTSAPGISMAREFPSRPLSSFTSEWRQWFGDSKVVDADGNPRVVYHGTWKSFLDVFRIPSFFSENPQEASAYAEAATFVRRQKVLPGRYKLVSAPEEIPARTRVYSIIDDIPASEVGNIVSVSDVIVRVNRGEDPYGNKTSVDIFTNLKTGKYELETDDVSIVRADNRKRARSYLVDYRAFVDERFPAGVGMGGRVYPVYLSIKNPIRLGALEANRLGDRLKAMTKKEIAAYIKDLESQGYDGIETTSDEAAFDAEAYEAFGGVPRQWIPFRPNQIKSVFNERPTAAPGISMARASDEEYFAAIERGDMTAVQAMVDAAARAAGYLYDGYHASRVAFERFLSLAEQAEERGEEFDYDGYEGGNLGRGFYFTPDQSYAKRFGTPRKFYLKIDNIVDARKPEVLDRLRAIYNDLVEDQGGAEQGEAYDALVEEVGADGVIAADAGGFAYGAEELLIKQSNQAKLADPIVRDADGNIIPLSKRFDVSRPEISFARPSDADYLAAVERGDMVTAQRMVDEAAKDSEYDIIAEHQTNELFTEFRAGEFGFHVGTGIPRGMLGQITMKLRVRIDNPLRMRDLGVWSAERVVYSLPEDIITDRQRARLLDEIPEEMRTGAPESGDMFSYYEALAPIREFLKDAGYDGIVYRNEAEGRNDSFIAFDPEQLKSADPVTRDEAGNVIPLSRRFDVSRPEISFARPEEDAEIQSLREQVAELKRQIRDVQNVTAAQRVNAMREVRVLERRIVTAERLAEQKTLQATRAKARVELEKQARDEDKAAADAAIAKMETRLDAAIASVKSMRADIASLRRTARNTEQEITDAEETAQRAIDWAYAIGRNAGRMAGEIRGQQVKQHEVKAMRADIASLRRTARNTEQEIADAEATAQRAIDWAYAIGRNAGRMAGEIRGQQVKQREVKALTKRLEFVEPRLQQAREALREARKDIKADAAAAQRAIDFAYGMGLAKGRLQGVMEGRRQVLARMAKREDALQNQMFNLRRMMQARADQAEEVRDAAQSIARDAASTLPVALRGPLAVRIAGVKTLAQANRIAVEAVKLAANSEVDKSVDAIRSLRKAMKKRGMRISTRTRIEQMLDQAEAGLRTASGRKIRAAVTPAKGPMAVMAGPALVNAVEIYAAVVDAATLVEQAALLHAADRQAFLQMRAARIARYDALRQGLAQAMTGRPTLQERERGDQPPRASLANMVGRANSDIYTLMLELEGTEAGVINDLLTAAQAGKGEASLEHASILRQLLPALQAAGYESIDQYALVNGLLGEASTQTRDVVLGGQNVTLPIGTIMSLAAMDDETIALFPDALTPGSQQVKFAGAASTKSYSPTKGEIRALLAGLSQGERDLIAAMKNILETQIRDRVMDAVYAVEGDQPPIVQNYWPRVREAVMQADAAAVLQTAGMLVRGALTSVGFAQARTGGRQPLIYRDAFQTWERHVQVALDMIHMAQPYRDAATVLTDPEVVRLMDMQMGDGTARRVLAIFSNGVGATARSNPTIIDKLTNNVTGAVLAMNPRTLAKVVVGGQIRLASEIPAGYWARGVARAARQTVNPRAWDARVEEIHSLNGYFNRRHQLHMRSIVSGSLSDADRVRVTTAFRSMADSFRSAGQNLVALNLTDAAGAFRDASNGANMMIASVVDALRYMDEQIMLAAVEARLAEVEDEGVLTGQDALREAALRAERDFRRTQNASDEFDDTAFAAYNRVQGTQAWRLLFPFSSDPLKARNQIRRAYLSGNNRLATGFAIGGNMASSTIIGALSLTTAGYMASLVAGLLGGGEPSDEDDKKFREEAKYIPANVAAEALSSSLGYSGIVMSNVVQSYVNRRSAFAPIAVRPIEQVGRDVTAMTAEDGSMLRIIPALLALSQFAGFPAYQLYKFIEKQVPKDETTSGGRKPAEPKTERQKILDRIERRRREIEKLRQGG